MCHIHSAADCASDGTGFGHRTRKVDVWLPGKGNSNTHGARPVLLITTMIKWTRTSRLSITNSLFGRRTPEEGAIAGPKMEYSWWRKRVVKIGSVVEQVIILNLRTTTSQKCEAVPRRARI